MDLKTKLKSRKFWIGIILVALGAVMWFLGERQNGIQLIVLGGAGYLGIEGIADIVSRSVAVENETEETEEETDIQ